MNVLIAGCGDVGGVLATALLTDGHRVYGLKRNVSTLPAGVRPIQADLTDPGTLRDLPGNIDVLVFMPTPASRDKAGYESIFIEGWKNVWAALKSKPARSLVVSSTAVYGESGGAIVNEETPPEPSGFNGKVLLEMEHVVASSTDAAVIVRISGIYGPGRERLIRLAAAGGLEVQKDPPQYTNRIHRDDAAAALKHLIEIEQPNGLYVVTDDVPAPRYDVIEWLAEQQGRPGPAAVNSSKQALGKRVDNRKLRSSGFELMYPDYRAGYGSVLQMKK
jgi:nucleoside-diphosphate-sugar epimerase